jgi:hypothetical protein
MGALCSIARISTLLGATGLIVCAALCANAASESPHIRLLSDSESAAIIAADGPAPPPCFIVVTGPCNATSASGTLTPCGQGTAPMNCTGATGNYCKNSAQTTICPQSNTGNYSSCPVLNANPLNPPCGAVYSGGGCQANNGVCVCVGGNPVVPAANCGVASDQVVGTGTTPCAN